MNDDLLYCHIHKNTVLEIDVFGDIYSPICKQKSLKD